MLSLIKAELVKIWKLKSTKMEMIRAIFVIVGYLAVFIGAYYFYFIKTDVKNGR